MNTEDELLATIRDLPVPTRNHHTRDPGECVGDSAESVICKLTTEDEIESALLLGYTVTYSDEYDRRSGHSIPCVDRSRKGR